MRKRMGTRYGGMAAMFVAVVAVLVCLGGCQSYLTDQEDALGEAAMKDLVTDYGGEIAAPAVAGYVRDLGLTMTPHVKPVEYVKAKWQFSALNSPKIQAFSTPGGRVGVTRGLLVQLEDETELGAVLAHEMTHVCEQHMWSQVGVGLLSKLFPFFMPSVGSTAFNEYLAEAVPQIGGGGKGMVYEFSSNDEYTADAKGCGFMAASGLNPTGMMSMLQRLQTATSNNGSEVMKTHPHPVERMAKIHDLLDGEYSTWNKVPDPAGKARYQTFKAALNGTPSARAHGDGLRELPVGEWCAVCAARGNGHATRVTEDGVSEQHGRGTSH